MKFIFTFAVGIMAASSCGAQEIQLTEQQAKHVAEALAGTVFYACNFDNQPGIIAIRRAPGSQWVGLGGLSDAEVRRSPSATTIIDDGRYFSISGGKAVFVKEGVATEGTCRVANSEMQKIMDDLLQ
jgi:hypothetical protein